MARYIIRNNFVRPGKKKRGSARGLARRPVYCHCREEKQSSFIACDNVHCRIKWMHYCCMGITHAPEGKYFCHNCRKDPDVPSVPKEGIIVMEYNDEDYKVRRRLTDEDEVHHHRYRLRYGN